MVAAKLKNSPKKLEVYQVKASIDASEQAFKGADILPPPPLKSPLVKNSLQNIEFTMSVFLINGKW